MNLVDLETFALVAEHGTLTSAAKALGVPKSTVSRRVQRLEDALGLALVHRAARSIALTDHGEHLFARSEGALRELREVQRTLRDLDEEPAGLLRFTAPSDLGSSQPITAMLARFRERYPKVRLDVDLTNRIVDLVAEGFDIALRPVRSEATWSGDGLKMRFLGPPMGGGLVTHPDSPEAAVEHPSEIAPDRWILHQAMRDGFTLVHEDTGERWSFDGTPSWSTTHLGQARWAALEGAGVAPSPWFLVSEDLQAGRLRPVLLKWRASAGRLGLLWPESRHLAPRVRAFIDHATGFVQDEFTTPPCCHTGTTG